MMHSARWELENGWQQPQPLPHTWTSASWLLASASPSELSSLSLLLLTPMLAITSSMGTKSDSSMRLHRGKTSDAPSGL